MLGKNIAKLRKEKGIKQIDFARMLHVTQGAVSQWENNRTRPDTDQLLSIASLFEVSVDALTGGPIIARENKTPKTKKDAQLDEFAEMFQQMDATDRESIMNLMKSIQKNRK